MLEVVPMHPKEKGEGGEGGRSMMQKRSCLSEGLSTRKDVLLFPQTRRIWHEEPLRLFYASALRALSRHQHGEWRDTTP